MRVFAIETVYRSTGYQTAGVDGLILSKEILLNQLNYLTVSYLLKHYKSGGIRRVYIDKNTSSNEKRPIGISNIKDRIVQTLFVQLIEPIIDPHADVYSFGFRRGRNAHQALGELSSILFKKPQLQRQTAVKRRYFSFTKHILCIDIDSFFDSVNHKFILANYPMPKKFMHLLVD